MANIRVTCPACKTELEIDSAFEGQEVECGNCLEVFKATRPGSGGSAGSSGAGKIPGAGPRSPAGSGRGQAPRRPPPRRRRRDDYDDDEDYGPPPERQRRGSGEGDGVATTSMILGILAVFPGCCCGLVGAPLALAAVITGVVGLKSQNNKGMAVAGLVMGGLALCWTGLAFVIGFGNAAFDPNRFR